MPEAWAGAVGVHQTGDEDGEEEDSENGFDDRERAGVRGNGRYARSAEGRQRAEAVIDKVEAVGDGVEVGVRIEIKGAGVDHGDEMKNARESESDEQIDRERAKNGFGIGVIARKDAAQNHANYKYIEAKAEDNACDGKCAGIGFEQPDVLCNCGNSEQGGKYQKRATVADSVDTEKDDCAADDTEHVVSGRAVVGEGIEDEAGEQEDEEYQVAAAGRSGSGHLRG